MKSDKELMFWRLVKIRHIVVAQHHIDIQAKKPQGYRRCGCQSCEIAYEKGDYSGT